MFVEEANWSANLVAFRTDETDSSTTLEVIKAVCNANNFGNKFPNMEQIKIVYLR